MLVLLNDPKHEQSIVKLEDFIQFLKEEKMDVSELNRFKREARVGEKITYKGMEITRIPKEVNKWI